MAQGDGAVYNKFKERVLQGECDLESDSLKVGLLTTGYTPNIDGDEIWTDVSGSEESGTGYTAGGMLLEQSLQTVDIVSASDLAGFDAPDTTWTGLDVGATTGYAVLYDFTHASDALIAYWELTTQSNGGDYTLQWHVNGILRLS